MHEFIFTNYFSIILHTSYHWVFFKDIFRNLSFINVLYILTFSCFVLELVVCESQNSCPNFSIFQIAFFCIDLILDCLISCKIFGMTIIN